MSLFLGKHEVKYLGMKGHGMWNLLSSSLGEREEKKNKAKVIKCYHLGNLVRMMKSLWELFIISCKLEYVKIKTWKNEGQKKTLKVKSTNQKKGVY